MRLPLSGRPIPAALAAFALPFAVLAAPAALAGQRAVARAPGPAVEAARCMERAEQARQRGDEAAARQFARRVLELAPEHFGARTFLGQRFAAGRWRLPEEIAYLQRAAAAREPAGATAPAPDGGDATADAAKAAVAKAADDAPAAARRRAALRTLRVAHDRRRGTAVLGLHLQHVRLLGFDTVPVGFGTGTGLLMLPRTESISFGGTVAVPLR